MWFVLLTLALSSECSFHGTYSQETDTCVCNHPFDGKYCDMLTQVPVPPISVTKLTKTSDCHDIHVPPHALVTLCNCEHTGDQCGISSQLYLIHRSSGKVLADTFVPSEDGRPAQLETNCIPSRATCRWTWTTSGALVNIGTGATLYAPPGNDNTWIQLVSVCPQLKSDSCRRSIYRFANSDEFMISRMRECDDRRGRVCYYRSQSVEQVGLNVVDYGWDVYTVNV